MKLFKISVAFVLLAWVALAVVPLFAWAQGPTEGQIKAWLESPIVLYFLMLAGSAISMIRQWGTAQMDGSNVTFWTYAKHLPELLTTFFTNTIAFALLIENDSLNFIAAVSIGYALNDLADLNPQGSRSSSLTKPPGDKP